MNLFDSEHTIHAILQHNAKDCVVVREPRVSLKETIDHLKSQALNWISPTCTLLNVCSGIYPVRSPITRMDLFYRNHWELISWEGRDGRKRARDDMQVLYIVHTASSEHRSVSKYSLGVQSARRTTNRLIFKNQTAMNYDSNAQQKDALVMSPSRINTYAFLAIEALGTAVCVIIFGAFSGPFAAYLVPERKHEEQKMRRSADDDPYEECGPFIRIPDVQ
ncbi:hypothetical protein B0H13DRAFT_1902984 [Mycena leptocephala]|nr:hypothetical protein B0H13DRAFT_1902984 [Mycena leptocephala]